MTKTLRLAALCCLLSSTAAMADDRIASPPGDLKLAYDHPTLPPYLNTRVMAVAPGGRTAAYVVQMPVAPRAPESETFLPTGAPRIIAEGARIMLVDLGTRQSARICASAGNDWDPVWSPDGKRLAFYSDRDGEARLWLYEAADQSCRRVAERPAKSLLWAHEEPRWSPDGKQIHFAAWPATGPGSPARARAPVAPNSAPAMRAGEVAVYRHQPSTAQDAAAAGKADSSETFDQRCTQGAYIGASLAVASVDGSGESRLVVDADVQGAQGNANRHYPTPYQRLSPSGRWLTYFDSFCRRPGSAVEYATRLYAVPAAGGAPVLVADNLRMAMGGAENILSYRWSPTSDELVYAREGQLWRVVFGPGGPSAPKRLAEALGPTSPGLHWYSEDGSMLLVGINPVRTGRAHSPFAFDIDLALVPVAGGEAITIPLDRAHWAVEGVVARDDRALLQPGPTAFRLFARDKTSGEAVVLTFDWRTGQMLETWRGRGRFLDIQAAGADRLVGIYEDFRTPANLFTYSWDLADAARLTDISPELRNSASSQAELFETVIPGPDGRLATVRTAVLMPPGARKGDRLPAVVWFYPGDDLTKHLAEFGAPGMGDPAYLLTSRGYAVILANVAIGPGDQRGHVIDEIMDSLMPQVHRAADLGYVDINRLAIRGHSFGGYGTAAVVTRTNLFRAAIPSAGMYDLGGNYSDVNFIFGAAVDNSRWAETEQPRLGQPVWDDPLRYIENSPYYLADRIRTPMLILQGADDFTGRQGRRENCSPRSVVSTGR